MHQSADCDNSKHWPGYWINMQTQYDLETTRDEWEAKVQAQVQPRDAA